MHDTRSSDAPVDSPVMQSMNGDDMLVATVTMRARASATGKEIAMPICQVIRFVDDLPIEWRNFAWDTARMLGALGIEVRQE